MNERRFEVSSSHPSQVEPVIMSNDELRQTYGFLVDVIDQEGFRHVVVISNGTRIEVNELFDTPNQHTLPQ